MSNATTPVLDAPPAEAIPDTDINQPIDLDTADFSQEPEAPEPEAVEAEAAEGEPTESAEAQEPATDTPPATEPKAEPEPAQAEEPAKPEEPPADEPAAPQDDKATTDRQAAIQQFQTDYATLQKKITDGTFDAIDDGAEAFKTLAKGLELLNNEIGAVRQQHAQQQQQTAAQRFWADFEAQHPHIGAKQGQELFQAEVNALSKRGFKGEALQAAATVAWERRIEGMKAAPPATKTPIKSPPVSKGGARVTPSASTTPPKPKPRSIDDAIEAGEYGSLREELGL